mmetsp:Transcript_146758/g.471093  ORF Transcript_146758/g.471093 Transcript_146758/m.471093 type:complete len:370 (-) Transcript_146758:303-1412(-)
MRESKTPPERPSPFTSAVPPRTKTRQEGMASTSCKQQFHLGMPQERSTSDQSLFSTSSMNRSLKMLSWFQPPNMYTQVSLAKAAWPARGAGGLPWQVSSCHRALSKFSTQVSFQARRWYPVPPCPPNNTMVLSQKHVVWFARGDGMGASFTPASSLTDCETMAMSSSWKISSLVAIRAPPMKPPPGLIFIELFLPPAPAACSIEPIFFCKMPFHFFDPPPPPPWLPIIEPMPSLEPALMAFAAAPAKEAKLLLPLAALDILQVPARRLPLPILLPFLPPSGGKRSWMTPVMRRAKAPAALPVGGALKVTRFHSMHEVSSIQPSWSDWYGIAECSPPNTKISSLLVQLAVCSVRAGGTMEAASSSIGDHS